MIQSRVFPPIKPTPAAKPATQARVLSFFLSHQRGSLYIYSKQSQHMFSKTKLTFTQKQSFYDAVLTVWELWQKAREDTPGPEDKKTK